MRFSTCMSSAVLALALIASAPGWAADIGASSWADADAANNLTPPLGWPAATMRPNEVSPAARAMMGAVKRWYNRANATRTSSGLANAQTLTYPVAPASYVSGDGYTFIAGLSNTGAATLNVNSLGAKTVKIRTSALIGGEIVAGRIVQVFYDGTDFQLIGGEVAASIGNNVALKGITGAVGRRVMREGFTTAGDGGAAPYTWSASNCSAADDGKQVQPTVTGCWIADFNGMKPTPKVWGATGDGTTNDAVAVQKAITAMADNTLYLGPYMYGLSSGVSCAAPTKIVGEGRAYPEEFYSGLRQLTANINVLTLCQHSYAGHFSIESMTVNTSGSAIVTGGDGNSTIDDIYIVRPCRGIDINGARHVINSVYIIDYKGAGCGGMRIGNATTAAATVGVIITNSTMVGSDVTRPDYGMLIEDAGGLYLVNNDILWSNIGTKIYPGSGQAVDWLFASNTVMGDTNPVEGLFIDTAHSTARIKGAQFTGTWTSSSTASSGIVINNTAGGLVSGLNFNGHRSLNNAVHGANVNGVVSNIAFDGVLFCGNGVVTPGSVGIAWGSGVTKGAVRNSTISHSCSGQLSTNQAYAVYYVGSNATHTLTGNYLDGLTGKVLGIPTGESVVMNNIGVDTAIPTIPSATSIALSTSHPNWFVSGTTAINTITGGWIGREVKLISTTGAIQYNLGGNLCNPVLSGSLGIVRALWDNTCWRMMQ